MSDSVTQSGGRAAHELQDKGKGRAAENDVDMGDAELDSSDDDDEEDDHADDEIVEDADEDNMEEIDLDNVVNSRTRGKRIDFAKAAEEHPGDDDDDEEDDGDFEDPEEMRS